MRILTTLVLAGLLVGCGGGSEPAGESPTPDTNRAAASTSSASARPGCDLATDAEVGDALGTPVVSHEESGLNGCRWSTKGATSLMLDVYAGSAVTASTCGAQKFLGTGREEAVEGLGDSALWKTSGSLVVCTGRAVIRFNLDDSVRAVPEDKKGLVALAQTVVGRL